MKCQSCGEGTGYPQTYEDYKGKKASFYHCTSCADECYRYFAREARDHRRRVAVDKKNQELKKRGHEVCVRCIQWDDNSQIENPNEVIKKIGEERCSVCLKSWVKGLEANQERLEKANNKTLKDLYNLNVKMISEGQKVDLDKLAKVFDEEIVQSLREYQAEVKRSKEEVNQSPTNPNSNNPLPQPTNFKQYG